MSKTIFAGDILIRVFSDLSISLCFDALLSLAIVGTSLYLIEVSKVSPFAGNILKTPVITSIASIRVS